MAASKGSAGLRSVLSPFALCALSAHLAACAGQVTGVSQANDWLVHDQPSPSTVTTSGALLTLSNGLISRTFVTEPCFTTVEYTNAVKTAFLRGLSEEATMAFNDVNVSVGACLGQMYNHYEFWSPDLSTPIADPRALMVCASECSARTRVCRSAR